MTDKISFDKLITIVGSDDFSDWVSYYNQLVYLVDNVKDGLNSLIDEVGQLPSLNTMDKSSIVAAINELKAGLDGAATPPEIGDLSSLKTIDKSTLVAAINELYDNIGLPLSNLASSALNVIESINNLSADVGNKSSLLTSDKTSLVNAINELVNAINSINQVVYASQTEVNDGVESAKAVSPATLAGIGQGATASAIRSVVDYGEKHIFVSDSIPTSSVGIDGDICVVRNTTTNEYVVYSKESGSWVKYKDKDQTIHYGSGAPVNANGNDGDVYVRTDQPGGIYIKTSGSWSGPVPGSNESDVDFTELTDTPSSYTGHAGKYVVVKSTEDGLEFVTLPTIPTSLLGLSDTPSSYTGQAGKIVAVKSTEDGIEFVSQPSVPSQFTDLSDTPSDYSGKANKFLKVDQTESSVIASDINFVDLTDAPSSYTGHGGEYIAVKTTEDGLEFKVGTNVPVSFTDLTDAPTSYTGQANKVITVKSTEDGLEFTDSSNLGLDQFVALTDTPASYSGQGGKIVAVKSDETGLEFITNSGGGSGSSDFISLTDTPGTYTGSAGKYVVVKSTEDGLEFVTGPSAGASDFISLTDTPSSYSGQAGKIVAVKSTEDGLEFIQHTVPAHDHSFVSLTDAPSSYSGFGGKFVAVKSTEDGLEFVNAPSGGGSSDFISLTDTPSSYSGQGGKIVAVKSTEDGLEFITNSGGGGASDFVSLTDTPSSYSGFGGKFVAVKSTEDGLEFVNAPSGGGSSDFVSLTDTPSSYSGQAGKIVAVKSTEDGLEFITNSSGSSDFISLTDTPSSYSGQAGKYVAVNSAENALEFVNAPSGGGTSDFISLTDTPASYSGQGGKFVAVKSTEDALEFVNAPSGGGGGYVSRGFDCTEDGLKKVGTPYVHVKPEDSSLVTTSGNNVTGMTDAFGLHDLTTSGTGPLYTNQINNKNVLTFNGNEELHCSWDKNAVSLTIFAVVKTTDTSSHAGWWESPMIVGGEVSGDNNDFGLVVNNGYAIFAAGPIDTEAKSSNIIADGNVHLLVATWDAGGWATLRVDGKFEDGNTVGDGVRDTIQNLYVGYNGPNAYNQAYFTGDIAEIIVYTDQLKYEDITAIEKFVADKWGISVPSDHPWAGSDPCASADGVINTKNITSDYTLASDDKGALLLVDTSSAGITITVPDDSSVSFPIGSVVNISQEGTNKVTIIGATGVTVNTPSVNTTNTQYSQVSIIKTNNNTWNLVGDLG